MDFYAEMSKHMKEVCTNGEFDFDGATNLEEIQAKFNELKKELTKIKTQSLYQYISKEHLDPEHELSEEEWDDFLEKFQEAFAEEASECAKEMFENYKLELNNDDRLMAEYEATKDDRNSVLDDLEYLKFNCDSKEQAKRIFDGDYEGQFYYDIDKDTYFPVEED